MKSIKVFRKDYNTNLCDVSKACQVMGEFYRIKIKSMCIKIFILCILLASNVFSQSRRVEPFPGELTISTSKESFLPYEEIVIDILIRNDSPYTVGLYIDKIEENFTIHDTFGEENHNCSIKDFLEGVRSDLILPNEEFVYWVKINRRYSISSNLNSYQISLKVPLWIEDERDLFDNDLEYKSPVSNTLYIDVVKPGAEQYEAWWRYEAGLRQLENDKDSYAYVNFKRIVDNYPESLYADLARKELKKFKY